MTTRNRCNCRNRFAQVLNNEVSELTPLMEAARDGDIGKVYDLATPDNVNILLAESRDTALAFAAASGHYDIIEYLVCVGAGVNLGIMPPLVAAALEGHVKVVKYLLKKGALVTIRTITGDSALSLASENGYTEIVEILLDHKSYVDIKDYRGRTPLMKACRSGHYETAVLLIKNGADVNSVSYKNECTPLSLACGGGYMKLVILLLGIGANVHHRLSDNRTMLIEATVGGHTDCARFLLDLIEDEKKNEQ